MEINKIKKSVSQIAEMTLKTGKQPVTPFIRGIPGVGKSQIIHQIKEELGFDEVIDLRMSQHDDTDIKGIPMRINGVFEWVPPEFIPVVVNSKFKDKKVILFFDELNRASMETIQSVFEVILDYKVGGKKLTENCFVVAAGNFGIEDGCQVTELDTAFWNRVAKFTVEEKDVTIDSWIKEFAKPKGINANIINFLEVHPRFLYHNKAEDSLITPRSWEMLSKLLNYFPKAQHIETVANIGQGIIHSATSQFITYLEENKKRLMSPESLINAKNTEEIKKYFEENEREEIYRMITEVISFSEKKDKYTKKQLTNVKFFIDLLNDDQKVATFKHGLDKDGILVNKMLEQMLTEFPEMGEEGTPLFNLIVEAL